MDCEDVDRTLLNFIAIITTLLVIAVVVIAVVAIGLVIIAAT